MPTSGRRAPERPEVVLFDADGVMQTNPPGWSEEIATFVPVGGNRFRAQVFEAERPAMVGAAAFRDVLTELAARWGIEDRVDRMLDHWGRIELDSGAATLVRELRSSGVRCYLVSNQHDHRAGWMRSHLGYDDLFDGQFYSCDLGVLKPAVGFFEAVLHQVGADPRAVVVVDDKADNVAQAVELGMQGVTWSAEEGAATLRTRLQEVGLPVR